MSKDAKAVTFEYGSFEASLNSEPASGESEVGETMVSGRYSIPCSEYNEPE